MHLTQSTLPSVNAQMPVLKINLKKLIYTSHVVKGHLCLVSLVMWSVLHQTDRHKNKQNILIKHLPALINFL
jgi:hypothetical protein